MINLATKGRSNFLLKVKTKAMRKKRQERIYHAKFSVFSKVKSNIPKLMNRKIKVLWIQTHSEVIDRIQ